jgi:hypothetical protein
MFNSVGADRCVCLIFRVKGEHTGSPLHDYLYCGEILIPLAKPYCKLRKGLSKVVYCRAVHGSTSSPRTATMIMDYDFDAKRGFSLLSIKRKARWPIVRVRKASGSRSSQAATERTFLGLSESITSLLLMSLRAKC